MLYSLITSIVYIAFVAEAFIGNAVSNPFYVGRADEMVDWETAKLKCELSGGQLATWSNKEQWDRLRSIITQEEHKDGMHHTDDFAMWLGITDLAKEDEWEFIDGDTSYCAPKSNTIVDCDDLDEWANEQPDNGHAQGSHCGAIMGYWAGKLNDKICSQKKGYICEYDADAMILGGVDLSDINVNINSIYIGFTHLATWAGAVEKCEQFGGQLATFGSEEEWSQLQSIIQENQKVYYNNNLAIFAKMWVGLTDIDNEGLWEFIDGDLSYCAPKSNTVQDCDDMEQWAPKEPNNVWGRGHCGNIEAFWGGRLADRPCEEEKQYICEITDTSILITGTNNEARRLRSKKINLVSRLMQ